MNLHSTYTNLGMHKLLGEFFFKLYFLLNFLNFRTDKFIQRILSNIFFVFSTVFLLISLHNFSPSKTFEQLKICWVTPLNNLYTTSAIIAAINLLIRQRFTFKHNLRFVQTSPNKIFSLLEDDRTTNTSAF